MLLHKAIKTAYALRFIRLISIAKSGVIGEIKDVNATFTKLMADRNCREFIHNKQVEVLLSLQHIH